MPHTDTCQADIAIKDILEAMRQEGSYLDISPRDVLALYRLAYAHAEQRLLREVPVSRIMSRDVTRIAPENTALEAARVMAAAGVSGLPVVSRESVVGVLSIKDLMRLLGLAPDASPAALAARCLSPRERAPEGDKAVMPVAALMTSPAVVISPDTPRAEAARLMGERVINRLPVVDDGRLVGMVTRGDLARSCSVASPEDAA